MSGTQNVMSAVAYLTLLLQKLGQHPGLRTFARSVQAFEYEETASRSHRLRQRSALGR
jgi:hypothetical protein